MVVLCYFLYVSNFKVVFDCGYYYYVIMFCKKQNFSVKNVLLKLFLFKNPKKESTTTSTTKTKNLIIPIKY